MYTRSKTFLTPENNIRPFAVLLTGGVGLVEGVEMYITRVVVGVANRKRACRVRLGVGHAGWGSTGLTIYSRHVRHVMCNYDILTQIRETFILRNIMYTSMCTLS